MSAMGENSFKKRDGGGAIQGHLYEFKLILLFTLRAILQKFKFKVASNMEEAGDFDDIVGTFEYIDNEGNVKNKTIFVQAKHVMDPNDKKITKYEMCQKKKGKFYLEKYFKSYMKIKYNESIFTNCNFDIKDCYLIIYTNTSIDSENLQYFECIQSDKFLNLVLTNYDTVYKIKKEYYELFQSCIDGQESEIIEFFNRLIFCVSQSNETELAQNIKIHISERYDEYNLDYINECFNKSSKLMQDWWCEIGTSTFVTEANDFVHESSTNLSVNRVKIVENLIREEILSKGIEFDKNFVSKLASICDKNKIVNIKCNVNECDNECSLLGITRALQAVENVPYIFVNEYLLKSLLGYETVNNFKHSSIKNLLIIVTQKLHKLNELPIMLEIKNILQKDVNKKLLLIYENEDTDNINLFENENILEIKNDFCLKDLSENCREKVLNSEINFHGKNLTITELFASNVEQVLTSDIISIVLLNNSISVGTNVNYLENVWNCYIPRKFIHNAHIDIRSLKACKSDIFLILTNAKQINRSIYFDNNGPLYPNCTNVNNNIYLHFNECNIEEIFAELFTKFADSNVHLLKLNNGILSWENTNGSIKTIQALTSKNNTTTSFTEQQLVERCNEHRIALISDIAGMGKTVGLQGISAIIKNNYPDLWIGTIDLNSNISKLTTEDFKDFESVKTFLLSILTLESDTDKAFFVSMLQIGKVALIFDGFDEVKTNMEEKFITIINSLLNFAISQIYISCRVSKQEHLEQVFNVLSYRFVELSHKDQSSFLANIWSQTQLGIDKDICYLKYLASKFLKKFNSLRIKDDVAICGIPLQLRIIAEIYQCPDSEITTIIDNESFHMSLTDIYNTFFERKIKITNERGLFCSQFSLPVKEVRKLHQLLAIRLLFADSELKDILSNSEIAQLELHYTNPFLQMYGIITKLEKCNVNFAHRTFAEYLVAEYVLNKSLESTDEKFQEMFVMNILINNDHKVLRIFMNDILSNMKALSFIIKNLGYKMWKKNSWFQYNLGCTPLHIAALENNYSILHTFIEMNKIDEKYLNALIHSKDENNKTALHVAAEKGNLNIVKLLHEKKSNLNNIDKFSNTVLVASAFSGNWELFNWLCENNVQSEKSKIILNMLLSMARFSGNLQAVNKLVNWGADFKATESLQDTALHESVRSGNIELITWYLKNGANVNEKNGKGNTALYEAVHLKLWDVAKCLIDNNADIHAINSEGTQNLHAIVISGNVKLVSHVLSKGIDLEIIDNTGNSVLYEAICNKHWEIADMLIESGANCNLMSSDGEYVLHAAIKYRNLNCISKCLGGKADINIKNIHGFTPLHTALYYKLWDIVYYLIEQNCDIIEDLKNEQFRHTCEIFFLKWMIDSCEKLKLNFQKKISKMPFMDWLFSHHLSVNCVDHEGSTFLQMLALCETFSTSHYFVRKGNKSPLHDTNQECNYVCCTIPNIQILTWLRENGVNVNDKNHLGNTALHTACENGNLILAGWLLNVGCNVIQRNKNDEIPLHLAAKKGNSLIVTRLLQCGSTRNAQDFKDNAPIHYAAKYGHIDVVKLLIYEDANIKAVNIIHDTVLHFAMFSEDIDLISLLIKEGCDINAENCNGDSVLHYAVRYSKLSLVYWLIDQGANVNVMNKNGDTVLHMAYRLQKLDIFKFLLRKVKSINVIDFNGVTDFHKIVRSCDTEILELMINKGARINCKTNKGATPLHYAAAFSNLECISHLIKSGASINAKDNDGCSILHEAIKSGSMITVKWLIEHKADVKALDKNGSNILHIVASSYLVEDSCKHDRKNNVLVYLLNMKIFGIYTTNILNETPLSIAEKENHSTIVTILKEFVNKKRPKRETSVFIVDNDGKMKSY